MRQLPVWLKQQFSPDGVARQVEGLIEGLDLTTVCQSAVCPNLRECWSLRQLTFMILGERCTRSCGFCAVPSGRPGPPAEDEPDRVADAVARLALKHVVITSVARDDLADEGARHFVRVIHAIRRRVPGVTVETLIPDLHGREALLAQVLDEGRPDVFAHNVETVPSLYPLARAGGDYERSLQLLRMAKERYAPSRRTEDRGQKTEGSAVLCPPSSDIRPLLGTKSSIMLGLGETQEEVEQVLRDLRRTGCDRI